LDFYISTHLCVEDIAKGYAKLIVQVNAVIAAIMQNLKQNNGPFMKTHTTKYTVIQDNAESRNRLIKNFKNQ
jgi:hypothetical protein